MGARISSGASRPCVSPWLHGVGHLRVSVSRCHRVLESLPVSVASHVLLLSHSCVSPCLRGVVPPRGCVPPCPHVLVALGSFAALGVFVFLRPSVASWFCVSLCFSVSSWPCTSSCSPCPMSPCPRVLHVPMSSCPHVLHVPVSPWRWALAAPRPSMTSWCPRVILSLTSSAASRPPGAACPRVLPPVLVAPDTPTALNVLVLPVIVTVSSCRGVPVFRRPRGVLCLLCVLLALCP